MKRLILIVGILILLNTIILAESDIKEGVVEITASVVDELGLELENVDFGIIYNKLNQENIPKNSGKITITGTEDARVKLNVDTGLVKDLIVENKGRKIKLVHREGLGVVEYTPKFLIDKQELTTNVFQLTAGKKEIEVTGIANITEPNSVPGIYSTDLTVKVQYDY